MRSALLFVIGLFVGACTQSAVAPPAPPTLSRVEAAEELAAKTVALVAQTEDGARAFCSGVWVSPTSILTAQHCVDDAEIGDEVDYVVRSDVYAPGHVDEQKPIIARAARLYASDAAHDLALLRAKQAPDHGIAVVGLDSIKQGAFAQSMGHSLGLWWSYSSGDIAAVRRMDLGIDIVWLQSTAPISPGNSGGGLFDVNNHLIGIASRAFRAPAENLNVFVHAQYVDALLRAQEAL